MIYGEENWKETMTAIRSGERVEITENVFYYFLEVLPPVVFERAVDFVPGREGEKVHVNFGFAEGIEPIVLFWRDKNGKGGEMFSCQRSNRVNTNRRSL